MFSPLNSNEKAVNKAEAYLSLPKRRFQTMFWKRPGIIRLIQKLAEFPGTNGDMELGNWHKYYARYWDDQIEHFLKHMFQSLDKIMGGKPENRKFLDLQTMRYLQFRAPSICSEDRKRLEYLIDNRIIFCNVEDVTYREELKQNILSFDGIIHSLDILQGNMIYMTFGIKILERYLPKLPKDYRRVFAEFRKTWRISIDIQRDRENGRLIFYERFRAIWQPPSQTEVESDHDSMIELLCDFIPDLAYLTILLACLRHFARLFNYRPRYDGLVINSFIDRETEMYILRLVKRIGFNLVNTFYSSGASSGLLDIAEPTSFGISDWRCGTPFTKIYGQLRFTGYLPCLIFQHIESDIFTPEYVLRDMITAFFGKTT